jgi:hypothetical protein
MSGLSLKADQTINCIDNGRVGTIKKYAIDCNHEIIARDQEIVGLRGGIVFLLLFYTCFSFLIIRCYPFQIHEQLDQ